MRAALTGPVVIAGVHHFFRVGAASGPLPSGGKNSMTVRKEYCEGLRASLGGAFLKFKTLELHSDACRGVKRNIGLFGDQTHTDIAGSS